MNNLLQAVESPATDKENVGSVDLHKLLVRVLAPPLGWNAGYRPFKNFQQRLLNPFSGDITGNGGIVSLAGDFINLIYIDDPLLGLFDIVIGSLDKL